MGLPQIKQEGNEVSKLLAAATKTIAAITKMVSTANPELYGACKLTADIAYKEAMNKRAVVFSMIPENTYEDHNRQDLVASRKDLCLEVVRKYNRASELYDQASHVKIFGKLPVTEQPDVAEEIRLKDIEIKPALDNARKAYNKLKGREATPERVALMQKHEGNIKKLEAQWLFLKPQK